MVKQKKKNEQQTRVKHPFWKLKKKIIPNVIDEFEWERKE